MRIMHNYHVELFPERVAQLICTLHLNRKVAGWSLAGRQDQPSYDACVDAQVEKTQKQGNTCSTFVI